MAYPVFTPQPTPVDVRLFGEAAEAGAKLGQEIPSALTSVVGGLEQGLKLEADLEAEQARTQATIQATKNAQAEGRIKNLEANISEQTQGDQLANTEATLQDSTVKANQDKSIREASSAFYDALQKASPEEQKQMVLNGQNSALFSVDPELFKSSLTALKANPTLTADERQRVSNALRNTEIDDAFQKEAISAYPQYLKSKEELLYGKGQDTTNLISNKLSVAPEQVPYSGYWVPSGTFEKDPNTGYIKLDPNTGLPKRSTPSNDEFLKGKYDFISNQPDTNGLVAIERADKEQRDVQENFKSQTGLQTGLHASYAKRFLSNGTQQSASVSGKAVDISTFGGASSNLNATASGSKDPFAQEIEKRLDISPETTAKVETNILQLKKQMNSYIRNPDTRNAVETKLGLSQSVNTIARSITDSQFDSSPAIQSQFTQSHVASYNESIDALSDNSLFKALPESATSRFKSVLDTFKVATPKDLYYVSHGINVTSKLNQMLNAFMVQLSRRDTNAASNAATIQSRNAYIQGVANGSPPG